MAECKRRPGARAARRMRLVRSTPENISRSRPHPRLLDESGRCLPWHRAPIIAVRSWHRLASAERWAEPGA
jgi:hypothetical protein